jgi:hypothetical protein
MDQMRLERELKQLQDNEAIELEDDDYVEYKESYENMV